MALGLSLKKALFLYVPQFPLNFTKISKTVEQAIGPGNPRAAPWTKSVFETRKITKTEACAAAAVRGASCCSELQGSQGTLLPQRGITKRAYASLRRGLQRGRGEGSITLPSQAQDKVPGAEQQAKDSPQLGGPPLG